MANLRAVKIYNDARRMLIAIESVNFQGSKSSAGCQLYGNIEPMAIITCTPDGIDVIDVASEITTLDKLRQDIPNLDNLIAWYSSP